MCVTKNGKPKKITGHLSDPPQKADILRNPKTNIAKSCQHSKLGFGYISNSET